MDYLKSFIKPELLVLIFVLYFEGLFLRNSEVKNKKIPMIIGGTSVLLCGIWVISTSELHDMKTIATALFTAIVQGVLIAGCSVYINQIFKQKRDD